MDEPYVYLILGSQDSGRRLIVSDLVEFDSSGGGAAKVFVSPNEPAEAIGPKADISVIPYSWDGEALTIPLSGQVGETLFIVADGRSAPADFVEAFHAWLAEAPVELARVITVVDCSLAERNAKTQGWFDCCIHFSDVAILACRAGVSNKWISAFQERYEKQLCYPCLFELDRKGRVRNPPLILDPLARRITRIFDEPDAYQFEDDDDEEEEEELEDHELNPGDPSSDPYLKRFVSGRREIEVPNIAELLASRE